MATLFICYTGNGHSSGPVTGRLNGRLFVYLSKLSLGSTSNLSRHLSELASAPS